MQPVSSVMLYFAPKWGCINSFPVSVFYHVYRAVFVLYFTGPFSNRYLGAEGPSREFDTWECERRHLEQPNDDLEHVREFRSSRTVIGRTFNYFDNNL